MPSLEGAYEWLGRAQEHLNDLKALSVPLVKTRRDALLASANFTPEPAVGFGYSRAPSIAPNRISILVGEAIQAMRRALDYLVYELAFLDTGSEQDGTQFPIEDSPNMFWARLERKKRGPPAYLYGVKREHAAAIERTQPYKEVEWTIDLRSISNPDKHRHLAMLGHEDRTTMEHLPRPAGTENPTYREIIPTEGGFTVLWTIDDSVDVKLHVTVYIAFEDRTGVVETLDKIKLEVTHILDQFSPCFSGKCRHR